MSVPIKLDELQQKYPQATFGEVNIFRKWEPAIPNGFKWGAESGGELVFDCGWCIRATDYISEGFIFGDLEETRKIVSDLMAAIRHGEKYLHGNKNDILNSQPT